jgi:hypothetical protein
MKNNSFCSYYILYFYHSWCLILTLGWVFLVQYQPKIKGNFHFLRAGLSCLEFLYIYFSFF